MKRTLLILLACAAFASCKKSSDAQTYNYACKLETLTEYADTTGTTTYSATPTYSNDTTLIGVTEKNEQKYVQSNTDVAGITTRENGDTIKFVTTTEICIQQQ